VAAVGGAGHKPGVPTLSAGGESQEVNKLLHNLCSVVTLALHKITEQLAVKCVSDIVVLNGVTAGARPTIA
jgi:hypothetical protein